MLDRRIEVETSPSIRNAIYFPLAVILLASLMPACGSSPRLEEGEWAGTLTPMNHPDMANPIRYDVRYEDDVLSLLLIGPNGDSARTENPRLEKDTLFFSFNEPEENVLLDCSLARAGGDADDEGEYLPDESSRTSGDRSHTVVSAEGFGGRCTDPAGQWAFFTMEPPG